MASGVVAGARNALQLTTLQKTHVENTTTMDMMGKIVEAFENAELRSEIKVMVGGAPLSDAFANKIGADAYAPDAAAAVETATQLITA